MTGQVEGTRIPEDLERDADGNFIPPDDAHCDEVRHVEDTDAGSELETTPFGRVAWVRANLTGVKNANGTFTALPTNDVVQLDIATGTTTTSGENFYRVWAPIADPAINSDLFERARGPMRFRLKRVDRPQDDTSLRRLSLDGENTGTSAANRKLNALLLVDNVIASYPPMKAWAIPEGEYVPSGKKNVIGWTGAVSPVKYPSVGATGLKAAAGLAFATNNPAGARSGWIAETKASMTYRWRYMNQIIDAWKELPLEMNGERLISPDGRYFELTNLVGDVEFKYDVTLDAPYYQYLDYSGSTKFTAENPTPGYLERIAKVTSAFNPEARGQGTIPLALPSCGTDFFFRLRAGKSDQLELQLEVRELGKTATQTNALWLVSDGTWKTYLKTTTNETSMTALTAGDYEFRIIGLDPQKVFGGAAVTDLPWSGKPLYVAEEDTGWTSIRIDAVTGALMFQVMESAESPDFMTYSIVRADYQDFALWSDAATAGGLYTGAFFEGKGKQSGSSPDARQFPSELPVWNTGIDPNKAKYWTEKFIPDSGRTPEQGYGSYRAYQPFEQRVRTPNGWQAWNGQWVCAKWRESAANGNMALQLGGDKSGGLEFTSVSSAPRGVDQLKLKARIAQMAAFDRFACYFGGALSGYKDYVFSTRAVMSTKDASTEFDGNGSISLVGYYQPGTGCYELRAERSANDKVRLYLYKWYVEKRAVKAKLLGYHKTDMAFTTGSYLRCDTYASSEDEQSTGSFGNLFIRCQTVGSQAKITVGVMNAKRKLEDSCSAQTYSCLVYTDVGTDNGPPLTYGAFGFCSLNCPAQIINPQYYSSGNTGTFPAPTGKPYGVDNDGKVITIDKSTFRCGSGSVTFPSGASALFSTKVSGKYANWAYSDLDYSAASVATLYALKAVAPKGELELFVRDAQGAGDDEEKVDSPQPVSGFKYNDVTFTVRNHEDTLLRLSTADESDDIVVDDVTFDQWCAASYDDQNAQGRYINADFNTKTPSLGCPTNWVYMNGWVTVKGAVHTVDLQPARVKGGGLLEVRAPLMDGQDGRGLGLGQISFNYRDADENCRVKVQYAPVNSASYLSEYTATTNGWIDVTNIVFGAMTPPERKNAANKPISVYVGQHGVRGVMRILIDPGVVKAVVDDSSLGVDYGRITITDFRASDEPPLDGRCWWGWNIRTTRDETERSLDDSLDTEPGLAAGLNNSVTELTEPVDGENAEDRKKRFAQHVPFVQSPTFGTNIVGEISFKARKLRPEDPATEVAVLGAKDGGVAFDSEWTCLKVILVTNAVFSETYSFKTEVGQDYASFRLAVIGIDDVKVNYKGDMLIPTPRRVLIDDVAVSEAVRAKLAFRDVSAFRSKLDSSAWDPNVAGNRAEQPMVREPWGVQGEVYAAQLEEEIDMARGFDVRLLWYRGERPWGVEKWRNAKGATSVALGRATGASGYMYRSNYANCPKAVIPATVQATNEVVQYALEVVYYAPHDDTPHTNTLSAGEWETPSWYHGAKYNAPGEPFSAYTILDSVAPGWAWINEINDFGRYNSLWENSDRTRQYVEVAIPQEANIKGWTLRFLDVDPVGKRVVTNVVAKFGSNKVACEKPGGPAASNCVFLVVADEWAKEAKTLDPEKGEVDGYWQIDDTSTTLFSGGKGSINPMYPLAVQLVRPSGVIEHEVLMIGTNFWEGTAADDFDPQKYLDYLNGDLGGQFIFAGKEHGGDPNSLGVVRNSGAQPTDWTYAMQRTPGRINEGQVIDPTHPTPFGSSVVVYLNIGRLGHILQEVDGVESRESQILVLQAGDPHGVDVTYRVDPWYEMGSITTNGLEIGFATNAVRTYAITVGRNASNEIITVEANAKVDGILERDHGLTKDNPYTPAVLDWLSARRDLHGHEWVDAESGVIKLAEYWGYCRNAFITNLNLTSMYWLDIPPTEGGWILRGGISEAPQGHFPDEADPNKTNVRYTVFMMISNRLETAGWATDGLNGHRVAHPPYVLRGLDPNFTSQDYDPDDSEAPSWTNVTFKVTGFMCNHLTNFRNRENHVPLRWFVFNEDSFYPRGHEKAFQSVIDFRYPYTKESPAQAYGVREWMRTHEERPDFFYFWAIDDRLRPAAVEILKADSTYHGL